MHQVLRPKLLINPTVELAGLQALWAMAEALLAMTGADTNHVTCSTQGGCSSYSDRCENTYVHWQRHCWWWREQTQWG